MEHEEEKGKLKEIKWQRGKGVGMEKKARRRRGKGKEIKKMNKEKKRSEERYRKVLYYSNQLTLLKFHDLFQF